MQMSDAEKALLEVATEVLPKVYDDALSSAMKQVGLLGEDAMKTLRMVLFPLQFTGALQDRLANYIAEAVQKVPSNRLIAPQQSMAIQVCERLRTFDEKEEFKALYINLLARMIDRERVGEAHPAFINVLSQLAPDEIIVVKQMAESIHPDYQGRLVASLRVGERRELNRTEAELMLIEVKTEPELIELTLSLCFDCAELSQPELLPVFIEHLWNLGIIEYTNETSIYSIAEKAKNKEAKLEFHSLRFTKFGKLFHKACVEAEAGA